MSVTVFAGNVERLLAPDLRIRDEAELRDVALFLIRRHRGAARAVAARRSAQLLAVFDVRGFVTWTRLLRVIRDIEEGPVHAAPRRPEPAPVPHFRDHR